MTSWVGGILMNAAQPVIDTAKVGAGTFAGGMLHAVGDGVNSVGASINGSIRGYGDGIKDYGNAVRDWTGASVPRASTASNPLGLPNTSQGGKRSLSGGIYKPYTPSTPQKSIQAAPAPATKAKTPTTTPNTTTTKQKQVAFTPSSKPAASAPKPALPKTATPKPATAPKANPSNRSTTTSSGKKTISAESKPKPQNKAKMAAKGVPGVKPATSAPAATKRVYRPTREAVNPLGL